MADRDSARKCPAAGGNPLSFRRCWWMRLTQNSDRWQRCGYQSTPRELVCPHWRRKSDTTSAIGALRESWSGPPAFRKSN